MGLAHFEMDRFQEFQKFITQLLSVQSRQFYVVKSDRHLYLNIWIWLLEYFAIFFSRTQKVMHRKSTTLQLENKKLLLKKKMMMMVVKLLQTDRVLKPYIPTNSSLLLFLCSYFKTHKYNLNMQKIICVMTYLHAHFFSQDEVLVSQGISKTQFYILA